MIENLKPFIFKRRIIWSDTDAAGIVYTVRIPQFCMESLEAWFIETLGVDWFELNMNRQIGTPFVNMTIDFRSMLTPHNALAITVVLKRIGKSSLSFIIEGRVEKNRLAFEASFTCVFVNNTTNQSIRIPEEYLARLVGTTTVS